MAHLESLYVDVTPGPTAAQLLALADLLSISSLPPGTDALLARRLHEAQEVIQGMLEQLQLEDPAEQVETVEPSGVSVKVGRLAIESQGPAVMGATVTLDGQPIKALREVCLSGRFDGVWELTTVTMPGVS